MKKQHSKHTPIISRKQRALFGAELARREAGELPRMKGITMKQLKEHLAESKGKKLPLRSHSKRKKVVKRKEWFD